MGVTRLKRKARRNKHTAAKRQNAMKHLSYQPVIKNVDQDALKASFGETEAPVVEEPKAEVETAVVEEVKEVVAEEVAVEEAPAAEEEKTEE